MAMVLVDALEPLTPLIVDLDGTLIKSDLLFEAVFQRLGKDPTAIFHLLRALLKGKAYFKEMLAHTVQFDPALLPYDETILRLIEEAREAGRPVYLASASNRQFVAAVADHLGIFTGWFGSDSSTNMSGRNKARLLTETFGDRGFDYIGNGRVDIDVWATASKAIGIRTPARQTRKLTANGIEIIDSPSPTLAHWLKLLRVHQYAKNVLVFLPLLTAHKFNFESVL
jgi:hypothetical protein